MLILEKDCAKAGISCAEPYRGSGWINPDAVYTGEESCQTWLFQILRHRLNRLAGNSIFISDNCRVGRVHPKTKDPAHQNLYQFPL